MIHQPSAGTQGKVTDMEIDVEHFLKLKKRLNQILADNTGKDPEQVRQDSERDQLDAGRGGPGIRPGGQGHLQEVTNGRR